MAKKHAKLAERAHDRRKKNRRLESAVLFALLTFGHNGPRHQARLTFSSILKTPLGEFTKRRLNALPRQRRSRVLRRVRLISAITILRFSAAFSESIILSRIACIHKGVASRPSVWHGLCLDISVARSRRTDYYGRRVLPAAP